MPFEKPPSDTAYIKLFVVVLLAVTGGNLLSTWITARVVEYQIETAASEINARMKQEATQLQQATAAARARGQKEATARDAQAQQSRREDEVGVRLAQACAEWTKANEELQSYTTKTEKEKACANLTEYVLSGVAPKQ